MVMYGNETDLPLLACMSIQRRINIRMFLLHLYVCFYYSFPHISVYFYVCVCVCVCAPSTILIIIIIIGVQHYHRILLPFRPL